MSTLVTADGKGRIPIRGSKPGQKYLVSAAGGEWRVTPYVAKGYPSRNRREWNLKPGDKTLFDHLEAMAELGLRIEKAENAQAPVPPCRF